MLNQWLGFGMILTGFFITTAASIGAWVALARLAESKRTLATDPAKRRLATFGYTYAMLRFALVADGGLCILVVGLVVGFGTVNWAPALPLGLLIATALVAAYARRRLKVLRSSM